MLQRECRFPVQLDFLPSDPLHNASFCIYLYMKLQVFIHGIDVIKDVMCNSWNDSHELRVVQLPLWTQNQTVTRKALLRHMRGGSLVQTHLPPVDPYEHVCCFGEDLLDISAPKRWQNDSTCQHSSPDRAPICFVSSCHLPSVLPCRYLHCHSPIEDRGINSSPS